MDPRNPLRFVAPLALVAALVSVIAVVQASRPESRATTSAAQTTATTPQRRGGRRAARQPRFYVVRPGDSLSVIAERTGVPVDQIERLNPDLDAQTLTVGQRLRLR